MNDIVTDKRVSVCCLLIRKTKFKLEMQKSVICGMVSIVLLFLLILFKIHGTEDFMNNFLFLEIELFICSIHSTNN